MTSLAHSFSHSLPDPRWQPIASAPPSGRVLVFSPRWGALIAERDLAHAAWLPKMQCPVSLTGEDDQPTHWMALPEAPPEAPAPARGIGRHKRDLLALWPGARLSHA